MGKTALSKEKGTRPTKKVKESKEDYFKSKASGWPSRHDRTEANSDADAVKAAAEATQGKSAKPTIWDLELVPPKWAPPALTAGKASPALAAALELHASKALRKLRKRLSKLCTERGMKAKLRALTLERWRFTAKQEEEDAAAASEAASAPSKKGQKRARSVGGAPALHPLIPTKAPVAEEELAVELSRQGLLRSDATSAAAALSAASAAAASNLLKLAHAAASGRPLPPPPITLTFNRHTIDVSSGKLQVKLSRQAYAKLAHFHRVAMPSEGAAVLPPATETLIETSEAADGEHMEAKRARLHYERESRAAEAEQRQRADTGEEATNGGRTALHQRLFALLLRYKTIQGHGFQAAIGPPVWQLLRKRLDVGVEGFGSPLNAYLPAFGSAFPDVDGPFGSRGSFFAQRPTSGSLAVNPPFVRNVMDTTALHIESLLTAAAENEPVGAHALSFCVFLPGWKEDGGYQKLSNSKFLRRLVLIAASDHGYCDGAAYQRQDPYRFSPYDTAVFVLQTDKASRKWPADDKFEKELRTVFAECTPSENAVKRQRKTSAGAKRAKEAKAGASGALAPAPAKDADDDDESADSDDESSEEDEEE